MFGSWLNALDAAGFGLVARERAERMQPELSVTGDWKIDRK